MKESDVMSRLMDLIKRMTENEREILLNALKRKYFREKRKKPRRASPMLLDYAVRDRVRQGFIYDISVGGVFIQTGESISVGQEILTIIPIPNSPKSVRIKGSVVRNAPNGIGVKFKRQPKA